MNLPVRNLCRSRITGRNFFASCVLDQLLWLVSTRELTCLDSDCIQRDSFTYFSFDWVVTHLHRMNDFIHAVFFVGNWMWFEKSWAKVFMKSIDPISSWVFWWSYEMGQSELCELWVEILYLSYKPPFCRRSSIYAMRMLMMLDFPADMFPADMFPADSIFLS